MMKRKPPLQPCSFDADEYERVILGTPVWAGRMAPPMRSFLDKNREILRGKKLAVFACSGGGIADKAFDGMKALLGTAWATDPVLFTEQEDPQEIEAAADRFCRALIGLS